MSVSILVVDDEADVADLFRQQFRREVRQGQYVIHFAQSAEEALDKLGDGISPELIVVYSDINMPGMDGLGLLRRVKEQHAHLPVIMVTAYGDDERRRAETTQRSIDAEAGFAVRDAIDAAVRLDAHAALCAFVDEHAHDLFRRVVAEQLAEFLLVVRDAMPLDELDEIGRRVARQRGFAEVRIGREVLRGRRAEVGEVAAPAAGHEDFLADLVCVFDDEYAKAALGGERGAEQSRGATAEQDRVERAFGTRCVVHRVAVNARPPTRTSRTRSPPIQ